VRWKSPPREDAETGWMDALRRHGLHTLLGVLWAGFVWWLSPSYLWWLLPVTGALILSIPLSVLTSRASLGRRLRRRGYLLIPEEARPPPVIRATRRYWRRSARAADVTTAIVDPVVNALVCAQGVVRPGLAPHLRTPGAALVDRVLRAGPETLSADERNLLIADPAALSSLHRAVWTSPSRGIYWRERPASRP
jgi:membrane glycosyltransferase